MLSETEYTWRSSADIYMDACEIGEFLAGQFTLHADRKGVDRSPLPPRNRCYLA